MFRIFAVVVLVLITIISPSTIIITAPIGAIWLFHILGRRAKLTNARLGLRNAAEERDFLRAGKW